MWRNAPMRRYLWFTLPLPLSFLLYGYSLGLPFFLDDGAHFTILAQTNGFEFWGNFPTFPFYRPLVFTIWKSYESLTGSYDPVALHYLNVVIFGVSGVLVGQVARRLVMVKQREIVAPLAGTLFILFPFSYQAVTMVAALFHLTLVGGILLCLWAGVKWLDLPQYSALLVLCWTGAFVALFSHENGVLTAPLLFAYIVVIYRGQFPPLRRILMVGAPIVIFTAVYIWRWFNVRPQDATEVANGVDVSFAVLLQGITYPIVTGARLLSTVGDDAQPLIIILLVTVCTVLVVIWMIRNTTHVVLPMIFALGWYVIAILPAALFLTAGYVLGQTRLALFASVGSSIFWAILLVTLWHGRWRGRLVALIVTLLFLSVSIEFLEMRRFDFLRLATYQSDLLDSFEANNVAEASTVVINAPDFLTPQADDRRFLLGSEGVLFVDPAAEYALQFSINSSYDYSQVDVIAYPAIQRNTGFDFSVHPPTIGFDGVVEAVRSTDYVYVTQFNARDFEAVLVGGTQLTPPQTENNVLFDDNVGLENAEAIFTTDGFIDVVTHWTINTPDAIKIFAHVYCGDEFIGQSDGYMWGDTYPLAMWSANEAQTDRRRIYFDDVFTTDCLTVYVGLYYGADVTRLQAIDTVTNEQFENNQVPVQIVIEGQS